MENAVDEYEWEQVEHKETIEIIKARNDDGVDLEVAEKEIRHHSFGGSCWEIFL